MFDILYFVFFVYIIYFIVLFVEGEDALFSPASNTSSTVKWPLFYAFDGKLNRENGNTTSSNNNSSSSSNNVSMVDQEPLNELSSETRNSVATSEWLSTLSPVEQAISDTTTSTIVDNGNNNTERTNIVAVETQGKMETASEKMADCIFEEVSYQTGDAMPPDGNCRHCFCAAGGIRICKTIHCSLNIEHNHCTPVIPEGHCCPIEYKCGK